MAAMSTLLKKEASSKQQGYKKSLFKADVDVKYICPHCSRVLRNPVQTGCGERFCRPCSDDILRDAQPTCPVCHETLSQKMVFRDVFAEREVLALPVVCENRHVGCRWEGHLRDLDDHMENCDFTAFHCPNQGCAVSLPKHRLNKHVYDDCLFRVVPCQFCGEKVQHSILQEHILTSCRNQPVRCKDCSQQGIGKDKMEAHIANDCPRQKIRCPLYDFGCTTEMYRNEKDNHDTAFKDKHIASLMSAVGTLSSTLMEVKQQVTTLKEENTSLKAQQAAQTGQQLDYTAPGVGERHAMRSNLADDTTFSPPQTTASPVRTQGSGRTSGEGTLDARTRDSISHTAVACQANTTDIQALKQTTDANSRSITVQDIQLSDMSLRLDIVDVKTTNGVLVWKIGDIGRRRREAQSGKTPSLYSAPFYTSPCGFKMCTRVYLDGDGMGKGACVSLFFVLMRGEYDALLPWPFQLRVTMILMDQSDSTIKRNITEVFKPDTRSASFRRPSSEMNTGSGCPMFAPVTVLESPTYVKDDTIFIKVIVDKSTTGFLAPDADRA